MMPPLAEIAAPPSGTWKLCTKGDYETWAQAGEVLGSELDRKDGFFHASDAAMVKDVARHFFKGRDDVVLLRLDPDKLAPGGARFLEDRAEVPGARPPHGTADVRVTSNGCQHIFVSDPAKSFPLAAVAARFDLPVGPDGEFVFEGIC